MTLFQRAHDIVSAKANKALDSAEKPDEMLDLSYEQMLDQITQVRRGLVTIAASRKQIELQEQQLQHSVDHLQDQAKAALGAGPGGPGPGGAVPEGGRSAADRRHGTPARAAHRGGAEARADPRRAAEKGQQLPDAEGSPEGAVHRRPGRDLCGESAAGISKTFGDSGAALQRAQDKIANMQARAGAIDELLQSGVLEDVGGDTDDIQKELDEAGTAAGVDQELAALKAQIGPGGNGSAPKEITGS